MLLSWSYCPAPRLPGSPVVDTQASWAGRWWRWKLGTVITFGAVAGVNVCSVGIPSCQSRNPVTITPRGNYLAYLKGVTKRQLDCLFGVKLNTRHHDAIRTVTWGNSRSGRSEYSESHHIPYPRCWTCLKTGLSLVDLSRAAVNPLPPCSGWPWCWPVVPCCSPGVVQSRCTPVMELVSWSYRPPPRLQIPKHFGVSLQPSRPLTCWDRGVSFLARAWDLREAIRNVAITGTVGLRVRKAPSQASKGDDSLVRTWWSAENLRTVSCIKFPKSCARHCFPALSGQWALCPVSFVIQTPYSW